MWLVTPILDKTDRAFLSLEKALREPWSGALCLWLWDLCPLVETIFCFLEGFVTLGGESIYGEFFVNPFLESSCLARNDFNERIVSGELFNV